MKEWINFRPGDIIKHYKGNIYVIIDEAKYTETNKEVFIYRNVKNNVLWVRPKAMFNDMVDEKTKRFSLIKRGKPNE